MHRSLGYQIETDMKLGSVVKWSQMANQSKLEINTRIHIILIVRVVPSIFEQLFIL